MIITDSSSNDVDIMKQLNCDVICIDHHNINEGIETSGECNGGHQYVIVNNTVEYDNNNRIDEEIRKEIENKGNTVEVCNGDKQMSCGVLVYEFFRVYLEHIGKYNILCDSMLEQWAGITLYTDVISTISERNQWYIDMVFNVHSTEETITNIIRQLNIYSNKINKSVIQYNIAPIINATIRTGNSAKALECILKNYGRNIKQLYDYVEIQNEVVNNTLNNITIDNSDVAIIAHIENEKKNYCGLIATKLMYKYDKSTAVYVEDNGLCKGSFRGKQQGINYQAIFREFDDSIYAQGHDSAFGFRLSIEQLKDIIKIIDIKEKAYKQKQYISLGDMKEDEKGIYHFNNIDELRKDQGLIYIAIGNSRVCGDDEIYIKVSANSVHITKKLEKCVIYDALGMECIAFGVLSGEYFKLYPEFSNELKIYIREIK
jgi:single-stranded DNA-specific DHH superfamily exonuclease